MANKDLDKDLDLDKVIAESIANSTLNEIEDSVKPSYAETFIKDEVASFKPGTAVVPTITSSKLRAHMSVRPWEDSEPTPPTFELDGNVQVSKVKHSFSEGEEIIELPFKVNIPRPRNPEVGLYYVIKELSKHINKYEEVLQILSNKNIHINEHFGTNNISFSLTDEELDKFITTLEDIKEDKGE